MKKKKGLKQMGFTLLELLMVTAASAAIIAAIFAAMRVEMDHMDSTNGAMTVEAKAREGLYRMIQEIRGSSPSRITIGNNGGTLDFTVPDPDYPVTAGYATDWSNGHDIQYALDGTDLVRTNSSTDTTTVIASDVSDVTFTGNANPPTVLTIDLEIQKTLTNGRQIPETPIMLSGEARIRNSG